MFDELFIEKWKTNFFTNAGDYSENERKRFSLHFQSENIVDINRSSRPRFRFEIRFISMSSSSVKAVQPPF